MQRCKRSKEIQTVGTKQARQAYNISQSEERSVSSTPTPQQHISQVVKPNQSLDGMDVITQAQAHERHKAWKSLDLERLT